jgi:hypothetical protein
MAATCICVGLCVVSSGAREAEADDSPIHPQMPPVGVVELLADEGAEFLAGHAQDVGAFLIHPLDDDDVRDGRDVPPPIARLRLAAQRLVALEDRLDILHALDRQRVAAGSPPRSTGVTTSTAVTRITMSNANTGGRNAHTIMPPAMVLSHILGVI